MALVFAYAAPVATTIKADTAIPDTTEDTQEVILGFFADASYEDANSYLTGEPEKPTNPADDTEETMTDDTQSSDKADESIPETGDNSNLLIPFAALIFSVAVGVLTLKRRKVQK